MNIFLIGYRCTGKTTVGQLLSEYLKWPFIDSDDEVEKEYNRTISEMVEEEGWDKFRKREKEAIRNISFLDKTIVSTGGGVILNSSNISNLRRSGIVVWLTASKETIFERMVSDVNTASKRPSLLDTDLEAEINETLSKRTPLYEKSCDFSINTDEINLEDISINIVNTIKERGLKI
ncbi:MAG: shikimate kinase [Deltaproteobacteria bacterium]|nr:shikimate kinase [Deltaproteobacteria bacterium]